MRPFGTIHLFGGRLYIQTGRVKDVSQQMKTSPRVKICAFDGEKWLRVQATMVDDNRVEAKRSLLDAYPEPKDVYLATDGNTQVLYLKIGA